MKILDGKALAQASEVALRQEVQKLCKDGAPPPILATILVGDDPASATYVRMKKNACMRAGLQSQGIHLPVNTSTEELLATIHALNENPLVHGILLQHPVPAHIDERACFDAISIEKDVDGVTCLGFGQMTMGLSAYGAATPQGIMRLLKHYDIALAGKHAVVVGRSAILGKPMAMMLLNADCTVTICHSKTQDLPSIIAQADIIIAAVGKPEFIKSAWVKKGAVVVDAGFHPTPSGGVGDVEALGIDQVASAYTPVPGGVGPMTINTLIAQTVDSAKTVC